MRLYGILIFKKVALVAIGLLMSSCNEQGLKTSYAVNSCLQETLLMLATSHPDRNMVYKVKEYKSNNYVLYLRYNKQWWYYRTIDEDTLIDKDYEKIKCPDYEANFFAKKSS